MAHADVSILIQATPEEVFWYVVDPQRIPEYDPDILSCKPLGEPATQGVGSQFLLVVQHSGRPQEMVTKITEWAPPWTVALESKSGVNLQLRWEIRQENSGTRLRKIVDLMIPGLVPKLFDKFVIQPGFVRRHEVTLHNIKKQLEQRARATEVPAP